MRLAGRVGGDQPVADVGRINLDVGDRLPGVRIAAVAVTMAFGVAARLDALGGGDERGLAAGGLHQPLDPALEAQAVDHHDLGVGELPGVGRRRRIDVRVGVRPDQQRHLDAVAADVFHHVAEDREGRDHLEPGVLRHSRRRQQQRGKSGEYSQHGGPPHASRCFPGNACHTRPPTRPNSSDTA